LEKYFTNILVSNQKTKTTKYKEMPKRLTKRRAATKPAKRKLKKLAERDESSNSEPEDHNSDLDYNPANDRDDMSDDFDLSSSDNESINYSSNSGSENHSEDDSNASVIDSSDAGSLSDASSNSDDVSNTSTADDSDRGSMADVSSSEEEIIESSSESSSEEDGDEESEGEEDVMVEIADIGMDDAKRVEEAINKGCKGLDGEEGEEVWEAIERSVTSALKHADQSHALAVDLHHAQILSDDNADYTPEEPVFIPNTSLGKRKSTRIKKNNIKINLKDESSSEDEEKELMKIEKELLKNEKEAEKLNAQKRKLSAKKRKSKKVKKVKKSDVKYVSDVEESSSDDVGQESSESEFEP